MRPLLLALLLAGCTTTSRGGGLERDVNVPLPGECVRKTGIDDECTDAGLNAHAYSCQRGGQLNSSMNDASADYGCAVVKWEGFSYWCCSQGD